ncbi:zinc finger FYVE domain-containing protein 9 isoform X2 [Denticeps clupeoides]|uniref:FYVE-type domain-containing protein n=1 Tax=Denticeps clupeoides TaxID=299321 RepID=A0AAY4ALC9_9TELE|nr:zinc finger FYVE domain-containing protein 9-like isoform X2 [Denticeps clupeoides]
MENYFQAEAFNLDKVLDEFEQNEDETETPTLSDAKWTQILAPPTHLMSLNPALSHGDLSPRDSPVNFKPLAVDPSSSLTSGSFAWAEVNPSGPDGKQTPLLLQTEAWRDERMADVHSPPLPQPNIGKLVSANSQEPALSGDCQTTLQVSGLLQEVPSNDPGSCSHQIFQPASCLKENCLSNGTGSNLSDCHFSFEEGSENGGLDMKGGDSPTDMASGESGRNENGCGCSDEAEETSGRIQELGLDHESIPETVQNGGGLESSRKEDQHTFPEWVNKDLKNGSAEVQDCTKPFSSRLENGQMASLQHLPSSKEDSVTEEKEMEESKQEDTAAGGKFNNGRKQAISVPYGGARPKQHVGLKLQIPHVHPAQLHNELGPSGKNKNQDARCWGAGGVEEGLSSGGGRMDPRAVRLNGENCESSQDTVATTESPNNDRLAGQQVALAKKPTGSLGEVAPVWVPDSQAPVCMKCEVKFTFTKRRHHCRACGKVFCATCCSLKSKLEYMDRKEARVCVTCHSALMNVQSLENAANGSNQSPNPNNPAEYCSTIPPLQQAQASGSLSSPPPTVMVPVGVLKQPSTEGSLSREQRRVWFADGILPNGEAADAPREPATSPGSSQVFSSKSPAVNSSEATSCHRAPPGNPVGSSFSLIPEDGLPPILISTGIKGDYAVEERPSEIVLMQQLEEAGPDPLVFVLNANLLAMVKLVNYVNRKCWYVATKGLHAVGQAEVVVLLQCLPDEKIIPKDLFTHFVQLYQEALQGNVLSHLGHSFFTQSFLGSKEHGGFLYISPTFQSLQDLMLPNPPYLFGILIQKWETPWAKVFPIRLLLRLGAEYRFYPCPLFSVRFRKPLFGETGHTIMNLLADFRNYQYTLPVVPGLVIDMEVHKTCIKISSNRYNELIKAMNKSNEHVLAMGACFNEQADSHLVCVQNDDGNYQTQAISIHHQPRKVTGACFFVFSGALKSSSGYLAKTSIVEDGVMVQIMPETMEALRQALREMKDFSITCGKADQEENQEHVLIKWTEDDHNFNKGVISPIDGKSMESITSIKIFHGSEYKANGKVIRWTEVFFLQTEDQTNVLSDPADHSRLTENVARAFCVALCPHLKLLKEDGMAKLGLRVMLDSDQVGYLAGSNGQPLLPQYLSDLDSALIPVIHGGACQLSEGPVVMELIFYILEIIS